MSTATFEVTGMTCGHCKESVTVEVSKIAGINSVAVDLEAGRLTVTSQDPITSETVIAAVDEAGYAATAA